MISERASMLRYTYIVCLVLFIAETMLNGVSPLLSRIVFTGAIQNTCNKYI
jgi:hypothetical protein